MAILDRNLDAQGIAEAMTARHHSNTGRWLVRGLGVWTDGELYYASNNPKDLPLQMAPPPSLSSRRYREDRDASR